MTITQSTVDVLRNVWLVMVLGTQAVLGAGRFYENLIVNGDASSGNQNSWTQEFGDSCKITSECSRSMFKGPNDANLFTAKSCRISQMIDLRFASKYIMTGRARMFASAYMGADGSDYSYFQVSEYASNNANSVTLTLGNAQNSCATYTGNIVLLPTTVQVKVAYTAQQSGLGLSCDAWGSLFQFWLTKETWSQSSTITPPPTPTPTTQITDTPTQSSTDSNAMTSSVSRHSPTASLSPSDAHSTTASPPTLSPSGSSSPSVTRSISNEVTVTPSVSRSPSSTDSSSGSASRSPSTTHTPSVSQSGSPTSSISLTISQSWSHSVSPSMSTTLSPSPTLSYTPTTTKSALTATINVGTATASTSPTSHQSRSLETATLSTSCGHPPIVTFLTTSSASGALGGMQTIAQINVVELLFQPVVVLWMSFPSETPGSWNVVSRQGPGGVATGGNVNASRVTNTTVMPGYAAVRAALGDEVWRLVVTAPPSGWSATSTSMYVTQRFTVYVSVLCVHGGSGSAFDYSVAVTAVGEPLPYTPAYQIGTTFSQSMAQIASGTVVPTSLSTMRALARLASCGTTSSGQDTSYGIVSVLVPLIAPLNLNPDGEVTALNILLCIIVAAIVLSTGVCAYAFLCRSVPVVDVLANFHLPSLLAPSVMFAFPTVLGTSIAIVATSEESSAVVVAVVGMVLSAVFVLWITTATALFGPQRVVAVRLPTGHPPKLPPRSEWMLGLALLRWMGSTIAYACSRNYSWKGIKGTDVQRNIRWKHAYHVLLQDVRFLLIPIAEAVCSTVATVVTALVTVPGVGCRAAICVIGVFYCAQTLAFLWLRPYTSSMMQVFAAATNILTLLATIGLAIDVFEVERVYGMRCSVAFQLMLLGMSLVKGLLDVLEFIEGSRRLWEWLMSQHDARLEANAHRSAGQLVVHYHEDDAVSDDGFNIMLMSVTEGQPQTPTNPMGLSMNGWRDAQRMSKSSLSSLTSEPETITRQQAIRPLMRSSSFDDADSDSGVKPSTAKPSNDSFRGDTIRVDNDAIHKRLKDRLGASPHDASHQRPAPSANYTAFMIDQPSEELVDVPIGRRAAFTIDADDIDDPFEKCESSSDL